MFRIISFFVSFRSFTQHWITVENKLRVLVLDFGTEFSLLIPNIEEFKTNKADMEVQIQEQENGYMSTIFKFTFQSPPLELTAPVLKYKEGYQGLLENRACVFPKQPIKTEKIVTKIPLSR